MGNVSTTSGRLTLSLNPEFKELHQRKREKLIDSIQCALKNNETGITISYLDLLVDNPNREVYDDYLIEPNEVKKIMNEIIGHPYTVENNKVMSGNVIFYNMSSLKILFVFGIQTVTIPTLHTQSDQWKSTLQQLSSDDITFI